MAFNYRTRANLYVNGTAIGEVFDVQVVSASRANAAAEAETPSPEQWRKVGGATPDSFGRECQGVLPDVDDEEPLPKPARVEKWQRWQLIALQDTIAVVETIKGETIGFSDGTYAHALSLLHECGWEFFGYAKPDKVEVGQRWRDSRGVAFVAVESAGKIGSLDKWELRKEGDDGQWFGVDMIDPMSKWEYLGMSENANVKQKAPRSCTGLQSVIAAKTEYVTVDDLSAPPVQTKRTADQARQDVRRANEEAAKRLIANPPAWAYTRAWMCAVLALQERANVDDHRIFSTSGDKICAEMLLEECERAHKRQPRISGVVYDPIRDVLFDAYARGMERPTLLGRPGVKGGISTCDLGGEYE